MLNLLAFVFLIPCLEAKSQASLGSPPEMVELTLRSTATVDLPRIFLSDIASCQGIPRLCAEIMEIDLGPSPEPGQHTVRTQHHVSASTSKKAPNIEIYFAGSENTHIRATLKRLSYDSVFQRAEKHLQDLAATVGSRIDVAAANIRRNIKTRPILYRMSIPTFSVPTRDFLASLRGKTELPVRLTAVNFEDESILVRLPIIIYPYEKIPVPTKFVGKGSPIRLNDIQPVWTKIDKYNENCIKDQTALVGRTLVKAARPGKCLTPRHLGKTLIVTRSQTLKIGIRKPGIHIKVKGKAMKHGQLGETIPVQIDGHKKIVSAKIINSNYAQAL